MKGHLTFTKGRSLACGRSNRIGQAKSVIFGLTPTGFKNVPLENRCKVCHYKYLEHQARKQSQ